MAYIWAEMRKFWTFLDQNLWFLGKNGISLSTLAKKKKKKKKKIDVCQHVHGLATTKFEIVYCKPFDELEQDGVHLTPAGLYETLRHAEGMAKLALVSEPFQPPAETKKKKPMVADNEDDDEEDKEKEKPGDDKPENEQQ